MECNRLNLANLTSTYRIFGLLVGRGADKMSKPFTNMRALIVAMAKIMNLINSSMQHHHEQVAYVTYQIGREMGLCDDDLFKAVYAALLHDIGGVIFPEQPSIERLEEHKKEIADMGSKLIRDLDGFAEIADIIAVCQNSYEEDCEDFKNCPGGQTCMDIAQAIHIADFVANMMNPGERILNQVRRINEAVKAGSGKEFSPKAVEACLQVSTREYKWLDAALNPSFLLIFTGTIRDMSLEDTVRFTQLVLRIIDFRSSFTAMHSAGVAASARELARWAGMTQEECLMMEIAGNLHDVGKLVVPNEILEKPGRLTEEEFNIVKEHPYYTRLILKDVEGFEQIANWAGYHHEKLDGSGYPFHWNADQLDLGARIMAVADIFSAITEVRPYRTGMNRDQALDVLKENAERGAICGRVVNILEAHYEVIDQVREAESRAAGRRYFQSISK